ncbi:kinetochore Sim4 complex subunit FTA2-domain-containing protein [Dactylonectria macrodidyma]|uniref:Kinetochore Sim4 complex subunit FTA2-domain-containing protein n=1 Tax=Dactylonectria macrodidyma TaxID=307937 RepID=A0A9P9E8Y2_9HYPO|nr:kinetochore Sim4 complex subunit FTA2-domain-containing protein [Dactylonectria macrodidyma]
MYPDWPEHVPLQPQPRCIGPKLKPFDFQGPQKIEFLEYLGEGLHSHVVKVKVHGQIYALKLFKFCPDDDWMGPSGRNDSEDLLTMAAFSSFSEPFNAECRAYGRLEEAGHTELAIQCFGYVLLDEEHERILLSQWEVLDIEYKLVGFLDMRARFKGKTKSGQPAPIRGILKEFGQQNEDLRQGTARKILRDIVKLQQLGIIRLDVGHRQLINGKIADFSTVITTPHYLTNQELRANLKPEGKAAVEFDSFRTSLYDYWGFEDMIAEWNDEHKDPKDQLSVYAFTRMWGRRPRYSLRSTPGRNRIYSLVDPRKHYDWKPSVLRELQNQGKSSGGLKSKSPPGDVSKTRRKLDAKPPRWYYDCDGAVSANLRGRTGWQRGMLWTYKNDRFVPFRRAL